MASRCFNNGKPKLDASDKTFNIKTKTIYHHNKNQFSLGETGNYDKTICYGTGEIKKHKIMKLFLL